MKVPIHVGLVPGIMPLVSPSSFNNKISLALIFSFMYC